MQNKTVGYTYYKLQEGRVKNNVRSVDIFRTGKTITNRKNDGDQRRRRDGYVIEDINKIRYNRNMSRGVTY